MAGSHIIKVNDRGIDAHGNDYNLRAQPHVIQAGLMVERPVLLEYPDGRLQAGVEVMLTAKGMSVVRDDLAAERAGHQPGTA